MKNEMGRGCRDRYDAIKGSRSCEGIKGAK